MSTSLLLYWKGFTGTKHSSLSLAVVNYGRKKGLFRRHLNSPTVPPGGEAWPPAAASTPAGRPSTSRRRPPPNSAPIFLPRTRLQFQKRRERRKEKFFWNCCDAVRQIGRHGYFWLGYFSLATDASFTRAILGSIFGVSVRFQINFFGVSYTILLCTLTLTLGQSYETFYGRNLRIFRCSTLG